MRRAFRPVWLGARPRRRTPQYRYVEVGEHRGRAGSAVHNRDRRLRRLCVMSPRPAPWNHSSRCLRTLQRPADDASDHDDACALALGRGRRTLIRHEA
jgi:hypothetical protein